jgi:hypothetical protein
VVFTSLVIGHYVYASGQAKAPASAAPAAAELK